MALELPPRFKNDILGRDTSLIPLVEIGGKPAPYSSGYWSHSPEAIMISTNSILHKGTGDRFIPILLNIPSIKESIDIETRKYKISSVNLDISNLPYDGKRF